ncbi:MAG TPA: hypothetical protein VGI16_12270 [Candidatus Acidoferrum sp.]
MPILRELGVGRGVLVAALAFAVAAIPAMAGGLPQSAQQSTGDAVADAARKAREQKKDAPKPKKVYTDDDVSKIPASAVTVAAAPSEAPADTTKSDKVENSRDAKADSATKGDTTEAMWRKRFRDARGKLDEAQKELDILQRESEKAQLQYYSDPQKALSEQYNRKDITDKDAKIAAKKQEVEQLKQKISDMEDQLRKSGGDSGWAR